MASILGSMPNKSFELVKAWMWTTNPKTKVLYPSRKYLLSTNLLQEWKKTTLGAAYITPTSTQRSLVQWEGKCTRNQAEQMQSFASCIWSLTLAFLFHARWVLKFSIPHTSCILIHVSILLSYPSCPLCHPKNTKKYK